MFQLDRYVFLDSGDSFMENFFVWNVVLLDKYVFFGSCIFFHWKIMFYLELVTFS